MKELRSMAANFILIPSDGIDRGPFKPMAELVVTVSEPRYAVDDGGGLIRRRVVEDFRFSTSPDGLRDMAERLVEWADQLNAMAETCEYHEPAEKKADKPEELR